MYPVGRLYIKVPTTLQRAQKQGVRTEKGLKKRKAKGFLNSPNPSVHLAVHSGGMDTGTS